MKKKLKIVSRLLLVSIILFACNKSDIDKRSYNLGVIGAFAEVVDIGIKELALSAAVSPIEMDEMLKAAEKIAKQNNVIVYRENNLLITDLFPEELTEGKHVLLICKPETLTKYQDLKTKKSMFVKSDQYNFENRKQIAFEFGKLLSYPDSKINKLLYENSNPDN